jgi:hypothetical protein
VLALLVYHATLFWQLWLYQSVGDWTLLKFVVLLLGPIMLLIGVSLLVPIETVPDFRAYFESMRGPFYSILIVMQLQPMIALYFLFDLPVSFHPILYEWPDFHRGCPSRIGWAERLDRQGIGVHFCAWHRWWPVHAQ